MSIHKVSLKKILLFSLISLFVLGLADFFIIIYVNHKNSETLEIVQTYNQKKTELNSIYLKSSNYHNCKSEYNSQDAFFECKLINFSNVDITNWEINIYLKGNATLKGAWNAAASLNNDIITVKTDTRSNPVIKSKSTYAFELYINYKTATDYEKIIIKANQKNKLTDFFIHKIIIILIFIIVAALIAATIVSHYMKREIEILNRITKRSYTIIDQTMKTFVNFIDAKDEYTKGHSTRVAEYSKLIAQQLGFDKQSQQDMYYMGLMHDIGKITVPDSILNKTGHLTTEEWAVIQLHTENGARLLQNFTVMPEIKDAVLYHHERYDGKGYLSHLKGEEIPLCARIICVADSVDAMSTNRCYRLKYSRDRIIQELERCSGKQFDPSIAKIMIDLIKDGTI